MIENQDFDDWKHDNFYDRARGSDEEEHGELSTGSIYSSPSPKTWYSFEVV